MNPSLGVNDWMTTQGFWIFIFFAFLAGAARLVVIWRRLGAEINRLDITADDDDPFVNGVSRCDIDGCTRPGTVLTPARTGHIWVCHQHGPGVSARARRPATEHVYDQELDSTDLGRWDQEMRA